MRHKQHPPADLIAALTHPHHREPGLERDKVIAAALELLDEVGLDGVTIRALAGKLNVQGPALYWYFKNKQELVNQMALRVMTGRSNDIDLSGLSWRQILEAIALALRRNLMSYHDGARLIASADLSGEETLKNMEQALRVLRDCGLPSRTAFQVLVTIMRYVLGCVFEEQADPRPKADMIVDRQRMLQTHGHKYPIFSEVFRDIDPGKAADAERQFAYGLNLLLDGVARQLEDHPIKKP